MSSIQKTDIQVDIFKCMIYVFIFLNLLKFERNKEYWGWNTCSMNREGGGENKVYRQGQANQETYRNSPLHNIIENHKI